MSIEEKKYYNRVHWIKEDEKNVLWHFHFFRDVRITDTGKPGDNRYEVEFEVQWSKDDDDYTTWYPALNATFHRGTYLYALNVLHKRLGLDEFKYAANALVGARKKKEPRKAKEPKPKYDMN